MNLVSFITFLSAIVTIVSGSLSIIAFFQGKKSRSNIPASPPAISSLPPQPKRLSPIGSPSSPGMLTPQRTTRKPWLLSSIPYIWAVLGGLAVEAADIMWLALIFQHADNGQYLWEADLFIDRLSWLTFIFGIALFLILTVTSMVIMIRLKRWGWFIGILLGSVCGTGSLFLPGLVLIIFGFAAPRTP